MVDPAPADARPNPRPRHHLYLLLVPILAIVVAGYVAGATWPTLVTHHPLVLIALSPINRFLLLTTNRLDTVSYYAVGLGRHLLPDPFWYLLGSWYGDRALAWAAETYPTVAKVLGPDGTAFEGEQARRFAHPIAFMFPNTWGSLFCGAADLPVGRFVVLNVAGTAARLVVCRVLGSVFSSELRSIADFVGRYQWPATAISVVLLLGGLAWQFRKGTGELLGLSRLSEELEGEDDGADG